MPASLRMTRQQRIIIPALPVSGEGVEILPVLLIPQAEALPIALLRFHRHRLKAALCTLLHHVVEAIGSAVLQARDKGVLLRQRREDRPASPSPVIYCAISTVNSSASPMTARNSRCGSGSGSIMAAVKVA